MSRQDEDLRSLARLARERLSREYPDSPGATLESFVHHAFVEGIPAMRALEAALVDLAQGRIDAVGGDLFHVYYHTYNAIMATQLFLSGRRDHLESVGEMLASLDAGTASLEEIRDGLQDLATALGTVDEVPPSLC